jgi:hypothetical protein
MRVNAVDGFALGDSIAGHRSQILDPVEERGAFQAVIGRRCLVGGASSHRSAEGIHGDNERNDVRFR